MNTVQKQLTSLRRKQQLMYVMIFSLLTALIWLAAGIISSQRKTGIDKVLLDMAKPLNPNINLEVISTLENKRTFNPGELSNFPIYKVIRSQDGKESKVVEITSQEQILATPTPGRIQTSLPPTPVPTPIPTQTPQSIPAIPPSGTGNPSL